MLKFKVNKVYVLGPLTKGIYHYYKTKKRQKKN